ncbi:unnamed protein product [Didymodactylos carnosus]|uniref:VLIG-type G domain-containing protein n=1 Tax=Didymodactylos carnosus TaxID=1234261 RepID=A0A8S2DFY9_9BILA|nr:unnamed protein product [Didymodactylos carnosus]CAF3697584.1 unnamed protein product [Didymodactylos carnosus]
MATASFATMEADMDRDDISIISSTSTRTTTSIALSVPPQPLSSSSLPPNASSATVKKITEYLELECNDKREEIISDLLINGRQTLYKYQGDLIPEVLQQEDDYLAQNNSPLLKLLKQHATETWETLLSKQPIIMSFINDVKNQNPEHFDNVLTRISEYGTTYTRSSSILSVVVQLLSESIDDECLMKTNDFNELWNTITIKGVKSMIRFAQHIPEEELEAQINNKTSPLYLSLRMYYDDEIKKLFSKCKIPNRQNTLYDLAIDAITEKGWIEGIESIRKKVTGTHYNMVYKEILKILEHASDFENRQSSNIENSDKQKSCDVGDVSVPSTITSSTIQLSEATIIGDPSTLPNTISSSMTAPAATPGNASSTTTTTVLPELDIKRNREIEIILNCITPNRYQLKHLMEAGELKYIDKILSEITHDIINQFYKKQTTFPQFIDECLTPVMFLLKRQQNLDDFMSTFSFIYEKMKCGITLSSEEQISSLSLRAFLHILLMNSDTFLRRIIISLISKRNPVPFVEPNVENWNGHVKHEFMPAIVHVWNYTRPTILSFGIGPSRGKSSLLNVLFQCTFEQNVDSAYFDQAIDIDFGYSFIPERPLNIADCHGQISKNLLKKVCSLFDGFFVHINQTYFEQHPKLVAEILEILPHYKFQLIFIRDVTTNFNKQQCQMSIESLMEETSPSYKAQIYPLVNMSDTNNREIQFKIKGLREYLLKAVQANVDTIIDKEQLLPNLYKLLTPEYVRYLKQTNQIVKPLKQRLLEKDLDSQNQNNFPLYLKFVELCKLRQQLKRNDFYGVDSERPFNINVEIFKLQSELTPDGKQNRDCGSVFKIFIELLRTENMLMTLNILASELKQELLNQGPDKLAGTLSVEDAFLSLEVLWRNCIISYDHTSCDNQQLILNSYTEFIKNGFPFEIIDGDNFHCQHTFLTNIMKQFERQRILVISIIGPQNSGKSTLLNYMFGTLFDVREGRCTRGIYGSLVKSNISGIDYLLLIDTEGLLSIEKADKEYDRRLVLFCLAVSHLVVVNMLGDINEVLKDMLTLCADSLKQLNVNRIPQPIIHFILNQKADPNMKNHIEAINKIISDLKDKELGEVINISTETFHTLPSAFKKERISNDSNSPCFLRTEPDFIEQTQKLVSKVTNSAKSVYDRAGDSNFNLPQWLATSVTIFDTLQKFPDLTYFKDLNERRQDNKIRFQIGEMMSQKLSAIKRQEMINQSCDKNEQAIRSIFEAEFQSHQDIFLERLENIFILENASDRIRSRSRQFLERQITETMRAWITSTIEANDRKQMELLVRDGAVDLRKLIDTIINSGRTMTKDEAITEFEEMWKRKLAYIKNNFNPEERLKQAIKFVYSNYNIFEKDMLPSHDNIIGFMSHIKQWIKVKPMEELVNQLHLMFLDTVNTQKQNAVLRLTTKPTSLTIPTIQNFTHLSKQLLLDHLYGSQLATSHEDTSAAISTDKPDSKHGFLQKAIQFVVGEGKSKSKETRSTAMPPPKPLADQIKTEFRGKILWELSYPINPSNILNIPKIFESIMKKIVEIVTGSSNGQSQQGENSATNSGTGQRPIEIDIIQIIVGLIKALIHDYNLELVNFDISLSRNLIEAIHSLVLVFLTILYYGEQEHHFDQQLETLDKQKPSLLNYFISMVVPDASCDKEGGEIFVDQILTRIERVLTDKAHMIIGNHVQSQKKLNRKELQVICDGKLQSANMHWMLKYIEEPTDFIVEEFQLRWNDVEKLIEQEIQTEKNQQKLIILNFFQVIKTMSGALMGEGSAAQFIDELFTSSGGTAAENLKNKGQCMVLLLYTYLKNESIQSNKSFTVFDQTYTITMKGVNYFQKLPKPDTALTKLTDLMSKSTSTVAYITTTTTTTQNQMPVTSIKNFESFLKSILAVEDKLVKKYDDISTSFKHYDKDKSYMKLLDKARGCTAKCPCCLRPCDADHSSEKLSTSGDDDNKHSCSTGHQLRAFSGIKIEVLNEASLYQCTEINNHDHIVVKGVRKTWNEMKLDYKQWDFDVTNTLEELTSLKSKFLFVWQKVGHKFCERFDMKYVTHNTQRPEAESYHYILLLDNSASMAGDRWKNLVAGVNVLIKARMLNGTNDRVTIITFDHRATFFCANQTMKDIDITKIVFTGGATNFSPAFQLVIDTLQSAARQNTSGAATDADAATATTPNLKHIIVLMSDGEAPYPSTELNRLVKLNEQIKEFWTVALGEVEMPLLEQITTKMDGFYKQLKNSNELIQVYAEIAQG